MKRYVNGLVILLIGVGAGAAWVYLDIRNWLAGYAVIASACANISYGANELRSARHKARKG